MYQENGLYKTSYYMNWIKIKYIDWHEIVWVLNQTEIEWKFYWIAYYVDKETNNIKSAPLYNSKILSCIDWYEIVYCTFIKLENKSLNAIVIVKRDWKYRGTIIHNNKLISSLSWYEILNVRDVVFDYNTFSCVVKLNVDWVIRWLPVVNWEIVFSFWWHDIHTFVAWKFTDWLLNWVVYSYKNRRKIVFPVLNNFPIYEIYNKKILDFSCYDNHANTLFWIATVEDGWIKSYPVIFWVLYEEIKWTKIEETKNLKIHNKKNVIFFSKWKEKSFVVLNNKIIKKINNLKIENFLFLSWENWFLNWVVASEWRLVGIVNKKRFIFYEGEKINKTLFLKIIWENIYWYFLNNKNEIFIIYKNEIYKNFFWFCIKEIFSFHINKKNKHIIFLWENKETKEKKFFVIKNDIFFEKKFDNKKI